MAKKKKSIWQIFVLSGAISVVFYALHIIIGEYLWPEYDPIWQTISELTAAGAPDAQFLRLFTSLYGIFAVIFAFSLYFIFKKAKVNRFAQIGTVLLIIMEIASFIGYYLFPLDMGATVQSFSNIMHMAVTAIVVICTIGFAFFTGIGLQKSVGYKSLGSFVLFCAFVITIFGALTPIVMMKGILISGLTERLNIYTLMICVFILSICLFHKKIVPSHTIFINAKKKKKKKQINIQYKTGKK